jgi:hypothetical protein
VVLTSYQFKFSSARPVAGHVSEFDRLVGGAGPHNGGVLVLGRPSARAIVAVDGRRPSRIDFPVRAGYNFHSTRLLSRPRTLPGSRGFGVSGQRFSGDGTTPLSPQFLNPGDHAFQVATVNCPIQTDPNDGHAN